MSNPTEDTQPYAETLDRLRAAKPRLAARLIAAERMRGARAALMLDGVRFDGLEELLAKLDEIAAAWDSNAQLARVGFLVRRAIADFETGVEAGLSGYPSVAADAMRDVMEIELLLLDFYAEPENLDAWLKSDRSARLGTFSPRELRRRLISLGLEEVLATDVATDYRAHSETLHVLPGHLLLPFIAKGHVESADLMSLDSSFLEIFEHARRLGNALLLVSHRLSPDSDAAEATTGPLPAFELAHQRTQELARPFLARLREVFDELDQAGEVERPAADLPSGGGEAPT
jgi:hypothetical protein